MMEFQNLKQIKQYLDKSGFFYTRNGAVLKPTIKTGDNLSDIKEILPVEELRLREIILNNIVNPLILIDEFNLRQIATKIDYRNINNYEKREKEISKLQKLNKELKKCTYIYVKNTGCYYQIQRSKIKKNGIYQISKELIPEDKDIKAFDDYNLVKRAFDFKKAKNKFKSDYERELDKFNMLGVCQW